MVNIITTDREIETLLQQWLKINNQLTDVVVVFNITEKGLENQRKLGENRI